VSGLTKEAVPLPALTAQVTNTPSACVEAVYTLLIHFGMVRMGPTTGALFTLPGETMAFFGLVAVLGAILMLSKQMSVNLWCGKVRSRQLMSTGRLNQAVSLNCFCSQKQRDSMCAQDREGTEQDK